MMNKDWCWWKHGVIYQVYPRSFYDSNGDGIGDIRGIIHKLDYIHSLGVDAIWLSPINTSPMYDFGYDIVDYRGIDPLFGTLKDFENLIYEAHERNIRIIMDMVLNHTSHLHSWFIESRMSRNNPKRDWYIWRDGKKDNPPNNWKSAFGGSAWEYDQKTGQYYLHSFLKEQPDVNWRNEELQSAMFNEMRYWLDKGVDGFRLDVVNWFVKDKHFRNNPPSLRPHQFLKIRYDRNRGSSHRIFRELRTMLDTYDDRMAVGEVFTMPPGDPKLSASYLGNGEDELHLAFDFSLMYRWWNASQVYKCIRNWYAQMPDKGWPCNVLSNHDQPRSISRFGGGPGAEKRARVAAVLLLTLHGACFIYYGEEIGMKNVKIRRKDIVDPLGKKYWPLFGGRDPARTPMQWSDEPNAGFSNGAVWLPISADFQRINVKTQDNDRYSILNVYRELISLRRKKKPLHRGMWKPRIKGKRGVLAYSRIYNDEEIFIVLNFTGKRKKVSIHHHGQWKVIFSTHKFRNAHFVNLHMELAPHEATIVEKIGDL